MQSSVDCWLPKCFIYQNMKEFNNNFKVNLSSSDINNNNNNDDNGNDDDDGKTLKVVCHPSKSFIINEPTAQINTNYRQRKRIHEMRTYKDDMAINNSILSPFVNDITTDLPPLSTIYSTSQLFPQLLSKLKLKQITRVIIAIGPDGGWSDEELYYFHFHKFYFIHLGNRVLRTDIAVSIQLLFL